MSRRIYEDAYEVPIYFNFTFRDTQQFRLKTKIENFEKLHPNLIFLGGKDITKDKPITTGPRLFADEEHTYREMKYTFRLYGLNACYQPTPALLDWLGMIDEFSEYIKNKRGGRKQ